MDQRKKLQFFLDEEFDRSTTCSLFERLYLLERLAAERGVSGVVESIIRRKHFDLENLSDAFPEIREEVMDFLTRDKPQSDGEVQ